MDRRNWLDLHRKLVDKTDMDYEVDAIEASIDSYGHDYYGVGCAQTPEYPNGLAVTLSGVTLTGTVSPGVAFDPLGERMRPTAVLPFNIPAAHATLARWDLLVIRYKKTGTTPVPKPSDPIQTIFLNLVDDFTLVYIPGTPSGTPVYPATLANDVIIDGIKVTPGDLVGTDCELDGSVRMFAIPPASRLLRHAIPAGATDGINDTYVLPQTPCEPGSFVLLKDGVPMEDDEYELNGAVITIAAGSLFEAAQVPFAIYLVGQTGAMAQSANTVPGGKMVVRKIGVGDGVQDTFFLPQLPIDPESVAVLRDGDLADPDTYTLTQQTLTFNAGEEPADGVDVMVIMLVGSTAILGLTTGGGGAIVPFGTRAIPVTVVAAVSVPVSIDNRQMRFVKSSGGAQMQTANPQIANGPSIGAELIFKGTSDVDYPILEGDLGNEVRGLILNGNMELKAGTSISLVYEGSGVWSESGRT